MMGRRAIAGPPAPERPEAAGLPSPPEAGGLPPGIDASVGVWPEPIAPRRSDTLFLMGNGPSLGRLSAEQKRAIAVADSMALNGYALHPETIGIAPTHYMTLDHNETVQGVMSDLPRLLSSPLMRGSRLWLSRYWARRCAAEAHRIHVVHPRYPNFSGRLRLARRLWRRRAWAQNACVAADLLARGGRSRVFTYGRLRFSWASTWADRPVQVNGTLTCALNLAWVMGYRTVQLVGVDLNDGLHYYPTDQKIRLLEDDRHRIDSREQHPTTVWSVDGTVPPVTEVLRQIERLYRRTGRQLLIANPESLPARLGIIRHRPLPPAPAADGAAATATPEGADDVP